MRALILTAGLGERFRPYTLRRAKPAVEFLNVPMLTFPYYWLNTLKLTDLTFNTHYLPETIRHAAMHSVDPAIHLHFTHEDLILGSGGGIWNARFHLMQDEVFAVANGDAVVTFSDPQTLSRMLRAHQQTNALATLLLCPLDGVGTRIPGVWVDGETVVSFGKTPAREELECLHYASYMFFSKRIWEHLPEGSSNILYDVLVAAIDKGERVLGFRDTDLHWYETGNATEYLKATAACLDSIQRADSHGQGLMNLLCSDLTPSFGLRSDLTKRLLIADNASIDPGVDLAGFCVIGEHAQISSDCRLEDTVVLSDAQVRGGERLKHALRD